MKQLPGEIFGPILHVVRFKKSRFHQMIDEINGTGFGLTLGVHSRIGKFADDVVRLTRVGNNYINRNMVGAVVGVLTPSVAWVSPVPDPRPGVPTT